MKKIVLSLIGCALALGAAPAAHAQANLIRLGVNSAILARRLSKNKEAAADGAATTPARTAASSSDTYEGKTFPMVRTPTDQLPKKSAEQVVAMETALDQCHAALLASPTGPVCTPEQRTAIQTAVVNLARSQSNRNLAAYQQEATFYLNEDARRQQALAAPAPAK
jgi:hypothetical protein